MYNKIFYDESINKKINLAIINDIKTELFFTNFLKKYILKITNKKKYKYIGFDLEFNTPPKSTGLREIAIFQLCFYMKKRNLIIFYNPKLVSEEINYLMKQLLINKYILKIGHGTDSLDINAIYIYLDNNDYCTQFTNNLYDTRFICEYLNLFTDEKLCNIYYLLKKYNVVTEKQYDFLEENHKKLGDFWNSYIDIRNLSSELINYSLYDALYLGNLFKKMILNINVKNVKLLMEFMHVVFLIKKNIIIFPNITIFNIYFDDNKIKLYTIFIESFNNFLNSLDVNIKNIFQIALFKNIFIKICMLYYYYKIINKKNIYRSKNNLILKSEKTFIIQSFKKFKKNISNYKRIKNIIKLYISNLKNI